MLERMTTARRRLAAFVAAGTLAAIALPSSVGVAHADIGDCVTVKGKGSKGAAKVCLLGFDGSEKGSAKLKVSNQKKSGAPNNVYVSVGFSYGGFNDGWRRLGPNSPKSYTKSLPSSAAYPVSVRVRLCYDKTAKKDPCFGSKVLDPGWVSF